MRLQLSEVDSVLWMGYEECLRRMEEKTLYHCIFAEEWNMLGDYLYGQGSQDQCDAHLGQK